MKDVNWKRWYAEGLTPGMVFRAFHEAQDMLVDEERDARVARGEFMADWPEWLLSGDYLPAGIRAEFARILGLDIEREDVHQLFDWVVEQH